VDLDYLKKYGLRLFAGIGLSLFFLLVSGMGWMRPVYSFGNYIVEPLAYWVGQGVGGIENFGSTITEIGNLRGENGELVVKLAKLEAELGKKDEIEKENEAFREQLDIDPRPEWELKLVRVLGFDRNGTVDHVIIDGGLDEDIDRGDVVVLGDVLVGEVREVYQSTAKVRLLTHKSSNVYAIDQKTRAKGLVRGSLEGLVMEEVLENEELNEGDTVITWEDEIPGGLVVGKITRIEEIATSSTKRAFLNPGFSYENLDYVFVIVDF